MSTPLKTLKISFFSFAALTLGLLFSSASFNDIAAQEALLTYGKPFNIQNLYGNGTYLETCGHADKCSSSTMYTVTTNTSKDRVGENTATWAIISVDGRPKGAKVKFGDIVYIKNLFGEGTYLETCGAAEKCSSTTMYTVTTNKSRDRAGAKTAMWQIVPEYSNRNGEVIRQGESVYLKNMYGNGTFLDSCGNADACSSTTKYDVTTNTARDRAGAKTAMWAFYRF